MGVLDKKPHTASIVTGDIPVEVLVLSKYDFYHLVDDRTQGLMQEYAKNFYFGEDTIKKTIQEQHAWDKYRGSLEEIDSRRTRRGSSTPR